MKFSIIIAAAMAIGSTSALPVADNIPKDVLNSDNDTAHWWKWRGHDHRIEDDAQNQLAHKPSSSNDNMALPTLTNSRNSSRSELNFNNTSLEVGKNQKNGSSIEVEIKPNNPSAVQIEEEIGRLYADLSEDFANYQIHNFKTLLYAKLAQAFVDYKIQDSKDLNSIEQDIKSKLNELKKELLTNAEDADETVEIVNAFEDMKNGFENVLKDRSVKVKEEGEEIKNRVQSKLDKLEKNLKSTVDQLNGDGVVIVEDIEDKAEPLKAGFEDQGTEDSNSKSRLPSHLFNKRKITDYDIEWLKKMQREYGRKLDWRTAVFLQMKVKGGNNGEHLDQSTTFGLPDSYFDAIRIHPR